MKAFNLITRLGRVLKVQIHPYHNVRELQDFIDAMIVAVLDQAP